MIAHPTRAPFVRERTYVDGKGPPPFEFFDQTQDAVLARAQSLVLGMGWAIHREDFDSYLDPASPDQLGQFEYSRQNLSLSLLQLMRVGGAGIVEWVTTDNKKSSSLQLRSAESWADRDYLLTAKVSLTPATLLPFAQLGFVMSAGQALSSTPGFYAGSDHPNFWVRAQENLDESPIMVDTGVPIIEDADYILQISRVRGVVRYHINGRHLKIFGKEGCYLPGGFASRRILSAEAPLGRMRVTCDFFHALYERYL